MYELSVHTYKFSVHLYKFKVQVYNIMSLMHYLYNGSSALCDRDLCKEEGGLLLPIDPGRYESDWICSCCQTITAHTEVQRIEDTYVAQFKNLPQGDLNAYYRFLNELGENLEFCIRISFICHKVRDFTLVTTW